MHVHITHVAVVAIAVAVVVAVVTGANMNSGRRAGHVSMTDETCKLH